MPLDSTPRGILSAVARELQNPLRSINGYAALIAGDGADPAAVRDWARRILSCGRWAGVLVEDLLDTCADRHGKSRLEPAPVDLADCAREAAGAFEVLCRRRGVSLSVEWPRDAATVLGDAHRLRQAIQNLLSNALTRVSRGRGRIHLAVRLIDSEVVVAVADNSEGLDPRPPDPISGGNHPAQGDNQDGSGLSIVEAIVERHGGRAWARSHGTRRGASFFISFQGWRGDDTVAARGIARSVGIDRPFPRRFQ